MTGTSGTTPGGSPPARSALSQRLLQVHQQEQPDPPPVESVIDITPLGLSVPPPNSLPPLHPGGCFPATICMPLTEIRSEASNFGCLQAFFILL